jgi:hypothetical protein
MVRARTGIHAANTPKGDRWAEGQSDRLPALA